MKEKSSFTLNAIALAFVAYERRIKRIVKQEQERFARGDHKATSITLFGPDADEITEAIDMLWQAYLCGRESAAPETTYALAVPAKKKAKGA